MRFLGAILLISFLTACGDSAGIGNISSVLSQNDISSQSIAWSANRAGQGYTIEVYRRCACVRPVGFYENYRVSTDTFDNRLIIEALDDEGSVIVSLPNDPSLYPNLEQIFTLMESSISSGGAVFAAFDVDESYPTRIDFGVSETYIIEVTGYF